jgi:predicted CopG family antitoxin
MQKMIFKHVVVSTKIYNELKNVGKAGDSFNDVIVMLLKEWNKCYPKITKKFLIEETIIDNNANTVIIK